MQFHSAKTFLIRIVLISWKKKNRIGYRTLLDNPLSLDASWFKRKQVKWLTARKLFHVSFRSESEFLRWIMTKEARTKHKTPPFFIIMWKSKLTCSVRHSRGQKRCVEVHVASHVHAVKSHISVKLRVGAGPLPRPLTSPWGCESTLERALEKDAEGVCVYLPPWGKKLLPSKSIRGTYYLTSWFTPRPRHPPPPAHIWSF